MILDELEIVEGGSWQPTQQWVAVVQPAAYKGVQQCLSGLLGQHPVTCTDVADVHIQSMADLADACLHIQPAVPQHSQVVCNRSDWDVGSRNAESFSNDVVVLTGELDDDGFFTWFIMSLCAVIQDRISSTQSSTLLTVWVVSRILERQIELGVICIQLHTQVVLAPYVSDWRGIKCKQLKPQHRSLWDATIELLFVRDGAIYAYSLETISQVRMDQEESLSTDAKHVSRIGGYKGITSHQKQTDSSSL